MSAPIDPIPRPLIRVGLALPCKSNDRLLCTSQLLRTYTSRLGRGIGRYGPFDLFAYVKLIAALTDARWFTREELLAVLSHPDGTNLRKRDYAKLDEITSGSAPKQQQQQQQRPAGIESASDPDASQAAAGSKMEPRKERKDVEEPPFKIPPRDAIAGILISDWAYGRSKL